MSSSTPSNTTTTTNSSPWSGEQPDIRQGLSAASNLYKTNPLGPSYYPGQTYAALNPTENTGLAEMVNTGMNGTTALNYAQNGVGAVGGGAELQPSIGTFDASQGDLANLMNAQNASAGEFGASQGTINNLLNAPGASAGTFGMSQGTLDNLMNTTGQTTGAFDQSEGMLSGLMSGGALNPSSNPYLGQAENNTIAATLPAIEGQFAAGGRADSGDAAYAASQGLASALGNLNYGQYNTGVSQGLTAAGQASSNEGLGLTAAANAANTAGTNYNNAMSTALGGAGLAGSNFATGLNTSLGASDQAGTNFNSGVSAINQAGLVAPGLNNAVLGNEQQLFGAGQAQQTNSQNLIQAAMNAYNYQQAQPYNALAMFENGVNGSGAQGGTTTETSPYYTNNFANVGAGLMGLAALGSTAQSLFGGGAGSAGILSGLLPFSDRRLKEDVEKVGTAKNGLAIYACNLIGDPRRMLGFMADEVEKKHPEAVAIHPSGYKMVDYGKAVAA